MCRNTNQDDDDIWDMWAYCDYSLIMLLLILISKTTDLCGAFGQGTNSSNFYNGYDYSSGTASYLGLQTGLFYGCPTVYRVLNSSEQTAENPYPVKVFGIEHFWGGNLSKMMHGLILDHGSDNKLWKLSYRMTRGRRGSSDDYATNFNLNTTGSNYTTLVDSDYKVSGFIKDMYVGDFGLLPKASGGSRSTP